jgi:hypothetical protein
MGVGAACAAIATFVRVPKIRILAVKDYPEGIPYAFWRVTGDSGATLDGVPEVRAGLPSLP